jgi:lipoprotein-anchoring transpeptidase ErfK/SrfK
MPRWVFLLMVAFALRSEAQTDSAPAKRVEIDKTQQMLRAYEDDRLVFETRISTGQWDRSTPNGQFTAGWKHRMHYSKLYHNAPMPYSVQVSGNVFIHGFSSVPRRPASHGCIRLPLSGGNPAKRFYEWVETGTPIEIRGRWGGR